MSTHTDLSKVSVSTAPSPATSGTTVIVTDANAAFLPNVYPWWGVFAPANTTPTRANAEIVKVTAGSSAGGFTTYTITRAQGVPVTSARTVINGDDFYEAIAAQDITDLESGGGWKNAEETWTYASASTITVPTGAAAKYAVGDRIKWTQTTVKYGVIVTVADTLLTIAVNTDYVVTNAAITLNYYSHEASPIGYPTWFNYTPTWSGSGSMTVSLGAARINKFAIVGKVCIVSLSDQVTTGGTASTSIIFTVPVSFTNSGSEFFGGGAFCYDGSTAYQAGFWTNANATTVAVRKYNIANWALAAGTYIALNFSYDIA